MLSELFEDPSLSHYSYGGGLSRNRQRGYREPCRNVDLYLVFAKARSWNRLGLPVVR